MAQYGSVQGHYKRSLNNGLITIQQSNLRETTPSGPQWLLFRSTNLKFINKTINQICICVSFSLTK